MLDGGGHLRNHEQPNLNEGAIIGREELTMRWIREKRSRCVMMGSIALAVIVLGCGGSAGGTCGQVEPCGGNLVGSWTVSGACVNAATVMRVGVDDGFTDICATSTVTNGRYDVSGTLMFNPDMTYSASLSVTAGFTWNVPSACLQGGTCAALQAALQQNADPAIGTVACTGSTSCGCTFTSPTMIDRETGTYTTSGTTLTTVASDGTTSSISYCVQGNTIHFPEIDTTMNMGPMGQATIDSDVIATKSR